SKKMVKKLITCGADVTRCNEFGVTPLMEAAVNSELAVIKRLIAAGAEINSVDSDGRSALIFAVIDGRLEVVKYLLKKGANVNIKNAHNKTGTTIGEEINFKENQKTFASFGADQ